MLTKLIMRGRFRPTDENPVNGVNVPLKVSGALNFVHLSHTHDLRVISLRRGAYPEGMGCKEARISRTEVLTNALPRRPKMEGSALNPRGFPSQRRSLPQVPDRGYCKAVTLDHSRGKTGTGGPSANPASGGRRHAPQLRCRA